MAIFMLHNVMCPCRDVAAFLEADNDVILVCTSILSLSEVLSSMPLTCLKRSTLFVDVLSVKEHPRNLLIKVLQFFTSFILMIPLVLFVCFGENELLYEGRNV